MPSTYTVNLGIEKPATGEQSGTWGDTTNVNFDIIDQAVNGSVRVTLTSAGTSGSPNDLNIVNGSTTSSEGRNKWIEIYSASDLGGSAYVRLVPNDAEKILFIRNSLAGSQSVLLFQGTYNASNDLEIPAGVDMVVKFDGAGASATVTDVFTKLRATEITTPTLTAGTADINGGSVDGATVGAASASTGAFTTLTASTSLNIASSTTVDGVLDEDNMASDSATKLATQQSIKAYVDSQVGTVDTLAEILANGNTSGANNLIINSGQALTTNTINETTAGTGVTIDSVLLKDDVVNATDIEVSNISANDGTTAATIANSTGNFTITNFISNSVDIGGGAIDGTTIGAASASTGAFTTLTASGNVEFDTNTLTVNASNERVGVGIAVADIDHRLGLFGSAGAPSTFLIREASDDTTSGMINFKKTRGSTYASNTALQTGDNIGRLLFQTANGTNTDTIAADMIVQLADSAAFNNGIFIFKTKGYNRLTMYHNTTGFVVNEDGQDYDFRVETNTTTHGLFVNADNDRIGIMNSSPADTLDINGTFYLGNTSDTTNTRSIVGSSKTDAFTLDGLTIPHYSLKWGATSGSPQAYLSGYGGVNLIATGKPRLKITATEAVINDDGENFDFRVESDNQQHMFFVDASTETVGIKANTPSGTLQVGSGIVNVGPNTAKPWISYHTGVDFGGDGTPTYSYGSLNARVDFVSLSNNFYINSSSQNIIANGSSGTPRKAQLHYMSDGTFIWQTSANTATANDTQVTSFNTRLELGNTQTVFNESGESIDFRVESDNQAHMLFVDASADIVGVKSSSGINGGALSVGGTIAFKNQTASTYIDASGWVDYEVSTGKLRFHSGAAVGNSSSMEISTNIAGAQYDAITIEAAGPVVINQDSHASRDFRVESDNSANMLLVDASTDRVAVKLSTSEPDNILDVNGSVSHKTTVSKYISTGAANSNYFIVYDKDFESSAFTTNQHHIRLVAAGATNGNHCSAEFIVTFKQQGGSKYFTIVPIENTALNIGYTYDASGGATGNGQLRIYAASRIGFYTYIQVFVTARDGNPDNAAIRGFGTATDTGSSSEPSGYIGLQFPLTYGANKYTQAGHSSDAFVINEESHDLDFRVESDNESNMLQVDAANDRFMVVRAQGSVSSPSRMEVELKETASVASKTSINGFTNKGTFTLKREANTGSHAFLMLGNDQIGSAIEQGRTNSASTWESYLRFYNKNGATGGSANVTDLSEFMTIYGDDYLRLASGTLGIQFGGASGAGDALYDVEYGTWVPDLQFSGAKAGITYERTHGTYLKVNNMVQVTARLRLTSKGTSTGNAQIHGLPFPTAYGSMNGYLNRPCPVFTDGAAGSQLSMFGFKTDSNSYITLVDGTSNGRSTMTNNNFTNATYLTFQIFYDTGS